MWEVMPGKGKALDTMKSVAVGCTVKGERTVGYVYNTVDVSIHTSSSAQSQSTTGSSASNLRQATALFEVLYSGPRTIAKTTAHYDLHAK